MGMASRLLLIMLLVDLFLTGLGYTDTSELLYTSVGVTYGDGNVTINESNFGLFNQTLGTATSGYGIFGSTLNALSSAWDFIWHIFRFLYAPVHVFSSVGVPPFVTVLISVVWTFMFALSIGSIIRGFEI